MRDYAVGNLITKLREEKGFSQEQLGRRLRVTGKAVSKWENGSAKPRMDTCIRMAEILDVSLDILLAGHQAGALSGNKHPVMQERRKKPMNGRKDTNKKKHIELHVRTGYSGMYGFGSPHQYMNLVKEWEQPAIAFTDLGATGSFPTISRLARYNQEKVIYGCEVMMQPSIPGISEDPFSVMLLVRNREGMIHLNHILTEGFLHCNGNPPHIPQKAIEENREGLLVGCSCNSNDLFQVLPEEGSLVRAFAEFFDYLEIEPVENRLPEAPAEEEIAEMQELTRKIVQIGKEYGIPITATGNVCYPLPDNAFDYAVLRYNNGETETRYQGGRYLRTTGEMLKAFRFLGDTDCRKVVIDHPRMIACMINNRVSLYPEAQEVDYKFWPKSKKDEEVLCREALIKAEEHYGSPLPLPVRKRLDSELDAIRKQESAFEFMLAQKLIQKSEEEGYPVGIRGSIASSLVAMLIGITDINPLPPHYRCPECKASIFDTGLTARCGQDLPKKVCPNCGAEMQGDGCRIPWQVLFRPDGTCHVDIDLNFSAVYRENVYEQVRELFGEKRVCHAGLLTGMSNEHAEKYIRRYLADSGLEQDDRWIKQRTDPYWDVIFRTGCHPGGIVIVPEGYTLEDFVPLQNIEDESGKKYCITHYDYNFMHDTLLKMDCLGHDTPTLLHLLKEESGVDPKTVSLNDSQVISLFRGTETVAIPERELLCKTATYGIPEFSSAFSQGILRQIMPETVEELIRVSGWSHGTDNWLGNAQIRIAANPAVRYECPATRDDILNDLQDHGMGTESAWRIMDCVRKGKGLKPEQIEKMKTCGISQAYINGCNKIKYLFPKAHAVAYVKHSLQIAWYKVYRPEAFYRSWLRLLRDSVDKIDYTAGPQELRKEILNLRNYDIFDPKQDIDRCRALELILEAKLRGIRMD